MDMVPKLGQPAGGGIRARQVHEEAGEWAWRCASVPGLVNDLYATMLCVLGTGHHRLTFCTQAREPQSTALARRVTTAFLAQGAPCGGSIHYWANGSDN